MKTLLIAIALVACGGCKKSEREADPTTSSKAPQVPRFTPTETGR